jgi:hypothetical protein
MMKKFSVFLVLIIGAALFFILGSCSKNGAGPADIGTAAAAVKTPFQPAVDSVSAASDTVYFDDNTLTAEELYETIHNLSGGALAVSTVNADGAPNLAYIGPDMIDDDVLMFGLSDNQTRINILERKIAVAGVYLYDPAYEGGLSDSRGARLVLRLIEDEGLIAELKQRAPDAPDDVLFMRIVKVLPVG